MTPAVIRRPLAVNWSGKEQRQRQEHPAQGGGQFGGGHEDAKSGEQPHATPAQREDSFDTEEAFTHHLSHLMAVMKQSNAQIEQAARSLHRAAAHTNMRAVPSTLGMPLEEAVARLRQQGLLVAGVSRLYSDQIPAGHVAFQMPSPGSVVPLNTVMELVVSAGEAPGAKKASKKLARPSIQGNAEISQEPFSRPMTAKA